MYLPNHLSAFCKPRYCRRVVNSTLLMMLLAGAGLLTATAQVIPPAGSLLNYTQIMFEYPALPGAEVYVVQVAEDATNGNFKQPVVEQRDPTTATLISGLSFGKKYQWRFRALYKKGTSDWQGPYSFEIMSDSLLMLSAGNSVLHVLVNNPQKNNGGLILPDFMRAAFNRNGTCVWVLPAVPPFSDQRPGIRDLRCNSNGTFSFIAAANGTVNAFVCDINGKLLWQAPDAGAAPCAGNEFYHHDFKIMPNGNYMVLSMKKQCDSAIGNVPPKTEYGTILEYNKEGKLVWQWNSEEYLQDTDIVFARNEAAEAKKVKSPAPAGNNETDKKRDNEGAHLNAFDTDSSGQYVYAGFRNISRVVKIEKKTGRVVRSWGRRMPGGDAKEGHGFFYAQHDINLLPNGNLALFSNNNFSVTGQPASAVIFNQPAGDTSQIVWQYTYPGDTSSKTGSGRGGNVDELTNGNFLICTGSSGKIFEINPEKQITWDAAFEPRDTARGARNPGTSLYRAHYTSSLYPCYFTIQLVKNGSSHLLKINNEGTEPDTYTVAGLLTKTTILPGKTATLTLPAGTEKVTVTSQHNPGLSRTSKVTKQ